MIVKVVKFVDQATRGAQPAHWTPELRVSRSVTITATESGAYEQQEAGGLEMRVMCQGGEDGGRVGSV